MLSVMSSVATGTDPSVTFRSSWRDVDWKIYLVWAGLEAAFLLVLVALYSSPWESDLPYLAATAVIALALLLAAFFIRVLRTGIGRDYTLTFGGDEIEHETISASPARPRGPRSRQ